jgi:hypothetical protein
MRFVCLLILAVPIVLLSQGTASISGAVVDTYGNPIPNAFITLADPAREFEFALYTDENGSFSCDSLEPGAYILEVEARGFDRLRLDNVKLKLRGRQSLRLDLKLTPSSTAARVKPE